MHPKIEAFFDASTFTYSYVVSDPASNNAAIIDPVLDYEPSSGHTSTGSADQIIDYVEREKLLVEWILETHVHADHLSAASYLKKRVGGRVGIGEHLVAVQNLFARTFNAEAGFKRDGSQFDRLFSDGEIFAVGKLPVSVIHTPGHTPACISYLFKGAAFVGDTLFMPDYGTARADFPGGDARTLYHSIQRIFALVPDTKLYMCHDYGTETRREFRFETTVADEQTNNIFVHEGIDEEQFVKNRECRDSKLSTPQLLLPAVQFNMRGAAMPPAENNGMHYFKIPVRAR